MSRNGTSQARVSRTSPGPDVIVFGQIARDLVLTDHAGQRGAHAQLGQADRLVGALAAEQLPALVHVGGPAGGGYGVDDEDQIARDLA